MECAAPLPLAVPETRPAAASARGTRPPSAVALSLAAHLAVLVGASLVLSHRTVPPPMPEMSMRMVLAPPAATLQALATAEARPAPTRAVVRSLAAIAPVAMAETSQEAPSLPRRVQRPLPAASPVAATDAGPSQPVIARAPATTQAGAGQARDVLAALEAEIHRAVQAAVVYPSAARMMHREGRAQVRFTYCDGSVGDVALALSSDVASLDAAALAAVRHAAVPRPPAALAGRTLTLLVWVKFGLVAAS